MKETKKSASGTFSSSAAARGKFGKICLILLLLVTAVFCGFAPQAQALEPNAEGVYELRTAQDLKDFRDLVNGGTVGANAKLMSDIDLGGESWTPIGTGPYPNAYEGTFDGGGFTVSGVKVNNGVEDPWFGVCAGFFGFTYGNVKNLSISGEISAESSGDIYIGGIAGSVQYDSYIPDGAKITNCSFSGSVSADSTGGHVCAGGVVGQTMAVARGAKIVGCAYTGGSVTAVCGGQGANNRVGGIVGQAGSNTVVDSCTASSEKISASGEFAINEAGGIAGELNFASMTNCTAASAAISAEGTNSNDAGGITGNAFNGRMSGCAYTGGAGSITAQGGEYNNIGGISGALKDKSSVSDCAWNEDSSGNAAGMGGYCVDEETTTALPAEEFESGEIILSVIPACPVVNLTPGGSSTLSFTAYPGGKPLTQEQAAKYISVPETAYSTFSIDTSVWPYVVKATNAVGTEDLVFSLYSTNLITGEPADAPTGNVTITVANAETPAVPVAEIKITPAELSMLVGGTQQLAAVVIPANATNNNVVTWGGGDAAVATVDENGLVTAHGIGTTTITATAGGVSASCSVTADVIHVESVSIDQTELQLTVGEKATLSAAITPENAADKNVTWSSDDAAVATVDENGLVTAHGIGTTTITATTADGGKTATCAVTVSASPQPAPPSGGGGGGCSAGLGALALLAIVPLFARRKK